jgi:ABC-type bacteriocin/lantibiotic exporter with double-glycine peptidase domain
MKQKLKQIWNILPQNKKRKVPFFIIISLLNSILEFISIAVLIPFILLLLDKTKANELFFRIFGYQIESKFLYTSLLALLLFYTLKNYFQVRLIGLQSKFIYGISSEISSGLITAYLFGNYQDQIKLDKGSLIRDFQKLPVTFSTHILIPLYTILYESFFVMVLFGIGFIANPWLSFLGFVLVVLGARLIIVWRNRKVENLNKTLAHSFQETLNQMLNIFLGNLQIKSANAQKKFYQKFEKANTTHNNQVSELSVYKQSNLRYIEIIIVLSISLLLVYLQFGNYFIDAFLVSIFASVIIKLLPAINKIVVSFLDVKANFHAVSILSSYSLSNTINVEGNYFQKKIEIENGTFRYNSDNKILKNINFTIEYGDFISIYGASGIGKTTLLRVLAGLVSLSEGTLKVDGITKSGTSFYPFVSFVPQQPFIFKASLLDNITMLKDEDFNLNKIENLLEVFDLVDFVSGLSKGLETVLDIDSMTISGGQKQRIAIIRALYSEPSLLILDEATNQLDEILEKKILHFLQELTLQKQLSIVAVSHHKIVREFSNKQFHLE